MIEYEKTGLSERDLDSLATYRGDYGRGEIRRLLKALTEIVDCERNRIPRSYRKSKVFKIASNAIEG